MRDDLKILIMGRTGSGKDYLARLLTERGLKQLISSTTRPKRTPEENTHVFLTKEEADAIPEEEKVARTVINRYEYFATKQQVLESDIYIIDPNGYYMLRHKMPDTPFLVVYVKADREEAKKHAILRASDQEREAEIFEERYAAEDEQFTAFENALMHGDGTVITHLVQNNFRENGTLANAANGILRHRNQFRGMYHLTELAKKNGLVQVSENGRIKVVTEDGIVEKSDAQFALVLMTEPEGVGRIVLALMKQPDVRLVSGYLARMDADLDCTAESFTGYMAELMEEYPYDESTVQTHSWMEKIYNLCIPDVR